MRIRFTRACGPEIEIDSLGAPFTLHPMRVRAPPALARSAVRGQRIAAVLVPLDAPDVDEEGKPTGTTHRVERDEGLRETTLEALAALKPTGRPDGGCPIRRWTPRAEFLAAVVAAVGAISGGMQRYATKRL